MEDVERAMPSISFPTLQTVLKQIHITFGLRVLVLSFPSTRFFAGLFVFMTLLCQFMVPSSAPFCLVGSRLGNLC